MRIQSVKNGSSSLGVYFSHNDYASLLLRFLIIVIDSTILLAISILIGLVLSSFNREFDAVIAHTMAVMVPVSYYYLAIYKRTDQSTVGYRVLGVKIISLEGKRPSIWQMTLRFFMLFFGPLNFFVDILWLTGEENKQTLRDKMFGTYVIKRQAQVKGTGKIIYYQQMFLGWNWMFREVERTSTE